MNAAITTANTRFSTTSGWTTASEPKCSATIWSTLPSALTASAPMKPGRFSRSSINRGDRAPRGLTRLALRCSRTDAAPNSIAAATAAQTAQSKY